MPLFLPYQFQGATIGSGRLGMRLHRKRQSIQSTTARRRQIHIIRCAVSAFVISTVMTVIAASAVDARFVVSEVAADLGLHAPSGVVGGVVGLGLASAFDDRQDMQRDSAVNIRPNPDLCTVIRRNTHQGYIVNNA